MNPLRAIHRWIGIALAVPLALVALSGTLLLFKDPFHRWMYPQLGAPLEQVPLAQQAAVLTQIEDRFAVPGIRVIRFPRPGVNAYQVYLADGSEAFVDPVTAVTIAQWHWHQSVPAFLFQLHAHLLGGVFGEVINGYIALLVVFMGLTGVLLWWPRRRSAFRLSRGWPRTLAPGDLLRAHAVSGVLLVVPALLFCITGAALVFYEPASRMASALLNSQPPEERSAVVRPAGRHRRSWVEILEAVRLALPESGPEMYYPGGPGNAVLTFRKRLPGEWHPNGRSYVLVDPYRAEVVQQIDARSQGPGTRMMHAIYPVHAARVGGWPMTVAAAVAGLGLAWLAGGAAWVWLARRQPRRREAHAGSALPRTGSIRL